MAVIAFVSVKKVRPLIVLLFAKYGYSDNVRVRVKPFAEGYFGGMDLMTTKKISKTKQTIRNINDVRKMICKS